MKNKPKHYCNDCKYFGGFYVNQPVTYHFCAGYCHAVQQYCSAYTFCWCRKFKEAIRPFYGIDSSDKNYLQYVDRAIKARQVMGPLKQARLSNKVPLAECFKIHSFFYGEN